VGGARTVVVVDSDAFEVDDGFAVEELPASVDVELADVGELGTAGGAISAPGCGFPAHAATSEAATKQDTATKQDPKHRRRDTATTLEGDLSRRTVIEDEFP
jgi:hypothetical protein